MARLQHRESGSKLAVSSGVWGKTFILSEYQDFVCLVQLHKEGIFVIISRILGVLIF